MAGEEKQKLPFFIHDQYIKDLSYENPNFLLKYSDIKQQPEVAVNVETHVGKVNDVTYEVTIKVVAKSNVSSDKAKEPSTVFIVDLTYGALVAVSDSLKNDILESILLVHVPFLMFPFVRENIATITRNGGYPPLLIEPIDFASLYLQKKNEIKKTQESNAQNNATEPNHTLN
jgi:preprotein translocase subunit SecB